MTEEERAERLAAQTSLDHRVPAHLKSYNARELQTSVQEDGYKQLYDLKDDAIDALSSVMDRGKDELRLSAANSVLDRLGLNKSAQNASQTGNVAPLDAEALSNALATMARVFSAGQESAQNASQPLKDITPPEDTNERN